MPPAPSAAAPASTAKPDWRPRLHFTAPHGWLNDPNGLVRLHGTWHLHYQFLTPRHWGHATSRDLFQWTDQPVALEPDALGDCWSGGAVHDADNSSGLFPAGFRDGLVAIFTAQDPQRGQRICLASSRDRGVTWQRFPGNPILRGPTAGFRDPKVFWHAPAAAWIMVLTENVHFTLFSSTNLREWRETGRFTPNLPPGANGYDCPDIFPLPIEGEPMRVRWVFLASYLANANFEGGFGACGQRYWVGDFDGCTFTPEFGVDPWLRFGDGPDEYATIVWPQDSDAATGRTLLIGWMNHWGYAPQLPTQPWQGCLTLPRELRLQAHAGAWQIRQSPARELWQQPHEHTALPPAILAAGEAPLRLGRELCGAVALGFCPEPDSIAELTLFADERVATRVGYDARRRCVYFDRRDAGAPDFHPSFPLRQEAILPAAGPDGLVDLLVIFDHSTVEIFAHDGAVYLAGQTLPPTGAADTSLHVLAGSVAFTRLERWAFHPPAHRAAS
ncbi:glycoside hydrolase family 32 protein [Horticoccus luteus]|uniref:Glycoside hydrolase family 32 protein n=1 Tax=Horticoccus luteus TaxID=2862869 RepID=A0A8F9TVW5_9BACT|nr:glycoside hydrolase family 32 protein [Horticoccus luteus]QYM78966.1 glycoside hydrolase family 32 protein [Horticoccus luteus]